MQQLTHVRCHMEDAKIAVETGVDGLDIVIGTSPQLMEHSHGKSMDYIRETALEVIEFVKSKGLEVRFSSEDSFRSDLVDLLNIYTAVDKIGVNRVGIADTIGVANPRQGVSFQGEFCCVRMQLILVCSIVYDLIRTLRGCVRADIETHFHNDTGCAIANAYTALEAGATHVDTSVLGIGERNGITPLGGFVARMLVANRDYVRSKYDLTKLKVIEDLVANAVEITVPFKSVMLLLSIRPEHTLLLQNALEEQLLTLTICSNYITGVCAFTHKAGIHAKAILANPTTYEIINPADFGMTRYVHFASRLTGWNAIKSRVQQLNLDMTDSQIKQCTTRIKAMADVRHLTIEDTDTIINAFYDNLYSKSTAEKPLLDDMTADEEAKYAEKTAELGEEPESKALDGVVEKQTDVLATNGVDGHAGLIGLNADVATT